MRCDAFRDRLQAYLDEELDGVERHAWRAHLHDCGDCRRWAVASDPTLLFAAVEPTEPDRREVDACADRVAALIRHERLERRLRPRRGPWLAAAAAVLLAVGLGAVWQVAPGGQAPAPEVGPAVVNAVSTEAAPPEVEPPQVEVDMAGEGVRVYQYAAGADDDTAVVFIVNPALES